MLILNFFGYLQNSDENKKSVSNLSVYRIALHIKNFLDLPELNFSILLKRDRENDTSSVFLEANLTRIIIF